MGKNECVLDFVININDTISTIFKKTFQLNSMFDDFSKFCSSTTPLWIINKYQKNLGKIILRFLSISFMFLSKRTSICSSETSESDYYTLLQFFLLFHEKILLQKLYIIIVFTNVWPKKYEYYVSLFCSSGRDTHHFFLQILCPVF